MISKNTQIISGPVLWCNIIYLPKLQTMIQKQRITKRMKNKLSQFNEMLDFFFSDFGFSKFQFILFMCQWDPNIFWLNHRILRKSNKKYLNVYNSRILFGMQTVSMQNFEIPQNVICFYHQKSIWICDHIHLLCIISVSTSNPASLW